jgi:hypothetical protein
MTTPQHDTADRLAQAGIAPVCVESAKLAKRQRLDSLS